MSDAYHETPKWMPISTVPKDRDVMLFVPARRGGSIHIDEYSSRFNRWMVIEGDATHWLPLPSFPDEKKKLKTSEQLRESMTRHGITTVELADEMRRERVCGGREDEVIDRFMLGGKCAVGLALALINIICRRRNQSEEN